MNEKWMTILKKDEIEKKARQDPFKEESWYQDAIDRDKKPVGLKNKFKRALTNIADESLRMLATAFWILNFDLPNEGQDRESFVRSKKFWRNATPEDKAKVKQWIEDKQLLDEQKLEEIRNELAAQWAAKTDEEKRAWTQWQESYDLQAHDY